MSTRMLEVNVHAEIAGGGEQSTLIFLLAVKF